MFILVRVMLRLWGIGDFILFILVCKIWKFVVLEIYGEGDMKY